MKKTYDKTDWKGFYCDTIRALAESAFKLYCADIWQHLYVCLTPSNDGFSFIPYVASEIKGDKDQIGINEAIPKNAEVYQLVNWLNNRCGRLPIIPLSFN